MAAGMGTGEAATARQQLEGQDSGTSLGSSEAGAFMTEAFTDAPQGQVGPPVTLTASRAGMESSPTSTGQQGTLQQAVAIAPTAFHNMPQQRAGWGGAPGATSAVPGTERATLTTPVPSGDTQKEQSTALPGSCSPLPKVLRRQPPQATGWSRAVTKLSAIPSGFPEVAVSRVGQGVMAVPSVLL
ncbi:hypothetical protein TREES_T100012082 [Tupaia chinensis]|uniref:Uncharacterized protein n=1 Tax=Tupaia chinensis TaxID=246437 RepID=L9K900_TUPCH|nr:hypothetical protein TREES_T100012082 [Tupaia chinensis]